MIAITSLLVKGQISQQNLGSLALFMVYLSDAKFDNLYFFVVMLLCFFFRAMLLGKEEPSFNKGHLYKYSMGKLTSISTS